VQGVYIRTRRQEQYVVITALQLIGKGCTKKVYKRFIDVKQFHTSINESAANSDFRFIFICESRDIFILMGGIRISLYVSSLSVGVWISSSITILSIF
jgi:hypothetical protein